MKKGLTFQTVSSHATQFFKHVIPATIKPVHSLWHEVIGFLFLVLASLPLWRMLRNPGAYTPFEYIVSAIFVLIMAYYGITSFRKARRISRS